MYNVNWDTLMQTLLPAWWRKSKFVAWMRVAYAPVVKLYAKFMQFREETIYDITLTGQTMSMEQALNDRFDSIGRGIYIENLNDLTQTYLYNKVEGQPQRFLYNKYNAVRAYTTGQFAVYKDRVWRAVAPSTGQVPSMASIYWASHGPRFIVLNHIEALQPFDFIVWVPIAIIFDMNEMRALVDTYRLAGKRYQILTY